MQGSLLNVSFEYVQVSLPIVRQFVKSVEEKALGVKVLKGVRPDQQLVKVVNDQLVELMGGQQEDLNDPKDGPQVCKMCPPAQRLCIGSQQSCTTSPSRQGIRELHGRAKSAFLKGGAI